MSTIFLPCSILNYFHFCFHCYCLARLSSTSYITAISHLLLDIPALKYRYCTTVLYTYCAVKYTKAQPLIEDLCT